MQSEPDSGLSHFPAALRTQAEDYFDRWHARLKALDLECEMPDAAASSMTKVWCSSHFVADSCLKKPEMLMDLLDSGDLTALYPKDAYQQKLALIQPESEEQLMAELRRFRCREMVRIAWRDIAGWADIVETLTDLSRLADACVQYALAFLYRKACAKRGTPLLANGSPQQLVVLGMGKLGAHELNYSSDIDLIFAYAEDGVLPDRKQTTYGEFFTRLCQSLIRVLDEITVDGFVFRTDIRLRPYGDSGAVVMTFDGMENYYLTQAREWERYAMIKARQIAGDFDAGAQLMAMLKAFVYRRYLDYGAFEELRSMKMQITQELKRRDRLENIKLGPGGIREVEFIGQAFQLIRGGTDKVLQTRGIVDVLRILGELGLLSKDDSEQLTQNYCFLRKVENRLQQYQDKQTHDLPVSAPAQQILAFSLDYSDWKIFKDELDNVREQVHALFNEVFSLSRQEHLDQNSHKIWAMVAHDQELNSSLAHFGFKQTEEILDAIKEFKKSPAIRRLSAKGAAVLDRLMPLLIEAMPETSNPDVTIKRILGLLEVVAGRNVYLSLLSENPDALALLIRLSSASSWICSYLSQYPILFDELLDQRSLFEPLTKDDLDAELTTILNPVDCQDVEAVMVKLREFKQLNVLRVAAADIIGVIPVMVVSDYLTYIAESIVAHVVDRSWQLLTKKYGSPPGCDRENCRFAVIGFGKFGGIELGYGSDLDLVFLYDCPDGHALTDGEKPISCSQFYGRLGLKVRHMLDTRLLSGVLYDVDLRLRPSGDSGLLVAHIDNYEEYYRKQAWTWEHQALVRGRFIAGDEQLKLQFAAIRRRILALPRETEQLKSEVREMRLKMRSALAIREADKFDLKQSKGGIADIEFIVQFGILDQASKNEALTVYTDNVRLLESLSAHGFMSKTDAEMLKSAYCAYRDYGHKLVLQQDRAVIDEAEVNEMSHRVERIWHAFLD